MDANIGWNCSFCKFLSHYWHHDWILLHHTCMKGKVHSNPGPRAPVGSVRLGTSIGARALTIWIFFILYPVTRSLEFFSAQKLDFTTNCDGCLVLFQPVTSKCQVPGSSPYWKEHWLFQMSSLKPQVSRYDTVLFFFKYPQNQPF